MISSTSDNSISWREPHRRCSDLLRELVQSPQSPWSGAKPVRITATSVIIIAVLAATLHYLVPNLQFNWVRVTLYCLGVGWGLVLLATALVFVQVFLGTVVFPHRVSIDPKGIQKVGLNSNWRIPYDQISRAELVATDPAHATLLLHLQDRRHRRTIGIPDSLDLSSLVGVLERYFPEDKLTFTLPAAS